MFFRDVTCSIFKKRTNNLKCSFLLHILAMKDFAISELPSHLPLSFPLSLNGVGSQVPSVTLQNSCCLFFFSISVATPLRPGYFLSTMKVTSSSRCITRAVPLNHKPNATDSPYSQDISRLLRRPCKSFILWPQDMRSASLSGSCPPAV